ncbi:hypothetical protein OPW41_17025 [Vibrio europaeus]|uniref:Uncharacterized protein n=1 Tax=Vibrio europaeus TaxID=300876 RepID=A0ABT5GMK1_9VIBR|nr:hypothetical protein [Vibrio europaeus]MDC5707611.1 hypothetical protein [Vibrio europaeus]MDC5709857.1 hypothetical protein [Vibrio europaeus]MDC5716666.1 hypothetical protein [Vibrio europaeus]MDC5722713.1 hypothetical protein [Vibrio europaeus]MDC5726986.1 hypothetical protein [Vibrio europaeus]
MSEQLTAALSRVNQRNNQGTDLQGTSVEQILNASQQVIPSQELNLTASNPNGLVSQG